jgi:hypothetical protein
MSTKVNWLSRRVSLPGPYLALCLSEEEYFAAVKHCKIKYPGEWVPSGFGASTHHLENGGGDAVCVVCMNVDSNSTPIETACLLVHEAVHVWQNYCESIINERRPGSEQEAYAIQGISQELMQEYARRLA